MTVDKTLYQHAMAEDPETGKPMQKVAAQITGTLVAEQKTQASASAGTVTFSKNILHLEIYNVDQTNQGVFNVNGINITVPAGKSFKASFGGTPRNTVTVTGSTSYILTRYE